MIDDVVSPLCKHRLGKPGSQNSCSSSSSSSHRPENKWFTDECDMERREFYAALNQYRNNKNEHNRAFMISK